ncbi:hypothetical protein APHAL10511_003483 [Amanita phalloides]|nr:hypothetical protein APHAL10511_003483 [Amanita phalloides]
MFKIKIANGFKKFTNKAKNPFHHRKLGVEDRSRPHSSLDVSSASHAPPPQSTVSLNDNISENTIPPAVPNQSQDTLLNPRTAPLHSSAPSQVEKAERPRSEECSTSQQSALVKAGSIAWKGLETALRLLERSADAFPPLKSAVSGLVACLDLTQAVVENHKEYERLANELKTLAEMLAPYVSKLVESDARDQMAHIAKSIEDEVKSVGYKQDRGVGVRIVEANEDSGDILQRYRRIESLFRQLQTYVILNTAEDARNLHEKALLDEMSPVQSARYNSKYSTNIGRHGCTAETREKIIEDLKDWAWKKGGAKVYWMNGMAGTGKTTIGYSLCEWLAKVGKLGGNFFCSRAEPSCRDANNIVPTLAFQLSQSSPAYRSALCKVLKEEPQASKLEVRWQFQKLIEGPIREVKEVVLEDTVIVIDALDECDDDEAFRLFLETLLKLAPDLPFKTFLTSRPEPVIRQKMLAPGRSRSVLHLHDIEESVVEADIKTYLTDAFHAMSPRPSSYQVEQLAKRAGRLFIYAATAVRYIYPGSHAVDSAARLKRVLSLTTGSGKQHEELDKLYTSVLSAAFDDALEPDEIDNIRLTLWTVVCAREPVSLKTIALLQPLTKDALQTWLGPLRSVLFVQGGVDGLVAPFHASFPEYILQYERSKEFHCNAAQHHGLLTNGCFDVMKAQLRFNICRLESSFVFDKDVQDLEERIKKYISPTLSYACRYWAEHLQKSNSSQAVHKNLNNFLRKHLLFWMEVLNLEQRILMGVDILRQVQNGLKDPPGNLTKQIGDAVSFVARFAGGACTRSTPHIYISAVPFCAKSSSVYDNYWGYTRGLMEVEGTAMKEWQSAAIVVRKTDAEIGSVAFSPDGTRIVSGWGVCGRVGHVRGRAPFEGQKVGPRGGPRKVFSPTRVWDARSGEFVAGPFGSQDYTVGRGSLRMAPALSLLSDCTIPSNGSTQWGVVLLGPFEGHKMGPSVAFSPMTRMSLAQMITQSEYGSNAVGTLLLVRFGVTRFRQVVAFSPMATDCLWLR